MVYLLGKNLSTFKRVWYALQAFEGVGLFTAKRICDQLCIHPLAKVKELKDTHLVRLKEILQPMMEQQRQDAILKLKLSKSKPRPIQP